MTERHDPNRSKHGEICWVEIPVHDVARAQKLYKDIFGWEYNPEPVQQHNPGIEHLYFFTKGGVHGAFLHVKKGYNVTQYGKLDKEIVPPLMTFCVKDCDEALTKAKAHGGKVQCPKTEIGGDMGYYARFFDTEGNVMGVWSQH